jgi:hypothetical protein
MSPRCLFNWHKCLLAMIVGVLCMGCSPLFQRATMVMQGQQELGSQGLAELSGVVVTHDGAMKMSGVTVQLRRPDGTTAYQTYTDLDGQFQISGVTPQASLEVWVKSICPEPKRVKGPCLSMNRNQSLTVLIRLPERMCLSDPLVAN